MALPPKQLTSQVINELDKEYLITFNYKTLSSHSKLSIGASGIQPYSSVGGLRIYFVVNGLRQNVTIPTTLDVDYIISISQERESNKNGDAIDFIIKVNNKVVSTSRNINAVKQSNVVISTDSQLLPNSEYNQFTVYKRGMTFISPSVSHIRCQIICIHTVICTDI